MYALGGVGLLDATSKQPINKAGQKLTFDDLWDWRLKQGEVFIGHQMKKSIKLFDPKASTFYKPEQRESKLQRAALAQSQKSLGGTLNQLEYVPPVAQSKYDIKVDFEADEDEDRYTNDLGKEFKEMAFLARLTPEQIAKKYSTEKKLRERKAQLAALMAQEADKTRAEQETRKQRARLRSHAQDDLAFNKAETADFQISDEDTQNKPKVSISLEKGTAEFVSFRNLKRLLKGLIQRKKKEKLLRTADPFQDMRTDADFQQVGGDVFMNKDYSVPTEGSNKKEQHPAVRNSHTQTVEALLKDKNTMELNLVAQLEAPGLVPPDNSKSSKTLASATKLKVDFPPEMKKSDSGGEEIDAKHVKPVVTHEDDTQRTKDLNLADNEAFKAITHLLSNPESIGYMTKIAKRRKKTKKQEAMAKEDLGKIEEEEKIMKYYISRNYQCLKLESSFPEEQIPHASFSSIYDILPTTTSNLKYKSVIDQEQKQAEMEMPMVYTMVELRKKKQKKKKKDKLKQANIPVSSVSNMSGSRRSADTSVNSSLSSLDSETVDLSESAEIEGGRRGSLAKQQRKQWLYTNDKYIVQKPFPLFDGGRKNAMLTAMSTGSPYRGRLNQVTNISSRTGRLPKMAGAGESVQMDVQTIVEKLNKEKAEDDKSLREARAKDEHADLGLLYQKIRKLDTDNNAIERFNWSGSQVMSQNNFALSQTEKVIGSLNYQQLEIWMTGWSGLIRSTKRYCREFVDSSVVSSSLMAFVFVNTLILGADGLTPDSWTTFLSWLNIFFTAVFVIESGLKFYGYGLAKFKSDFFNIFDVVVAIVSIVEVSVSLSSDGGNQKTAASAFRAVRIFRIFRVLRVTRLLRSLRFMKIIIEVIKGTLEQFAYISLLLFLFIFIFTLLGTQIYGGQFTFMKNNDYLKYNFDRFENAFYSVFVILTLENWNTILVTCMRSDTNQVVSFMYLFAWIFIGNYIFLNLFLAILLDGFDSADALQMIEEIEQETKELDRMQTTIIEEIITKRKNTNLENQKANEQVMKIIDEGYSQEVQERQISQATYLISREVDRDEEDLSEELDIEKMVEKKFQSGKPKNDPYEGVDCVKSLYYFTESHPVRLMAAKIVTHPRFETIILLLIMASSTKLVVETYIDFATVSSTADSVSTNIDTFFTFMFLAEAVLKIIRNGFFVATTSYLRDSWSILDFVIVISSLIDFSVSGSNLSILRSLRLLRTLRPLRFISQNRNMKIVVNALLESLIALMNVFIVILMVWIMFAILGSNLMQGKMGKCVIASDPNFEYYGVNQDDCINLYGGTWKRAFWNFDDISESLVTLYVLSNGEGWPNVLSDALDANDSTEGPLFMNSTTNGLFIIVFILVGTIFLMNLFVGVIFVQFTEEQVKEKKSRFKSVTDDQMRWMMVQDLISKAKPNFDVMLRPKGKERIFFFKLIHSKVFEIVIMISIILNIVSMGMVYETMSTEYSTVMENINTGFTVIFALEMILKLIALDFQYFKSNWNNFDFAIVVLSLLDLVLETAGSSISWLKTGPQYARLLRVLRVTRLFKLMKAKQLDGINKIIKTLIFSFPSLLNVLVLLFLVYFIFSVLAVFLFKSEVVTDTYYYNELWNFNNFHLALMTLFRCSTGEDWPGFMYLYTSDSSTSILQARAFFIIYIFLSTTVMLKVFQLVVMQQFDEFYFNPDNPINSFDDASQTFHSTWNLFTTKQRGTKIKATRIVDFFTILE